MRRRLNWGWEGLWRGLLSGAILWAVVLIFYKLFPISEPTLHLAGKIALGLPVLGAMVGLFRRSNELATARWMDEKQGLKERISTALELKSTKDHGDRWTQLVLKDAASSLGKIDLRRLLPFRVPRSSRWCILALAVGAGLGFVPEYRSDAYLEEKEEADNIKETGEYLARFAKKQLQRRPISMEETRQAVEEIEELGEHLSRARLTRDSALKDIANVTEKVKEQLDGLENDPALKRMQRAAKMPTPSQGMADGQQEKMEAMREQLGDAADQMDAMDKLQKALDQLKASAAGMKAANGPPDPSLMNDLSEALSDLAEQAENLGLDMPNLEAAINALKSGQVGQMVKEMDMATLDLNKMMEMAKALQQMEMKRQEQGRDLAEQLERGQAQSAASRLLKMAKDLKSGKSTPEAMAKLAQELAEALKPAENYGEVAEHLQKALQKMQASNGSEAASECENAAAALDDLVNQLGDLDMLKDQLKGLETASMCIGNGLGWGQCASNKIGWKQGGGMRPQGVGTWADNDDGTWRWIDYSQTRMVDNSGVQRPDMDSRGLSDRGQSQLPAGLIPDKVKGRFSEGGPMPSIPLKGLSIKGTSNIEYTEAVSGAQSGDQASQNQDRVPRAYQNAVRSYFDDWQ